MMQFHSIFVLLLVELAAAAKLEYDAVGPRDIVCHNTYLIEHYDYVVSLYVTVCIACLHPSLSQNRCDQMN